MDIALLAVGRTTVPFVIDGIDEYERRLKHYIPFAFTTIADVKRAKNMTADRQKDAEGELILSKLSASDYVVLLDEHGREYTSVGFSEFINRQMVSGRRRLVFVIGGPYGFSKAVYDRANEQISLSRMTFNHEMVRLFFIEQLYRAMTILRGEPYHHE